MRRRRKRKKLTFVGTLLELLVVVGALDEVDNRLSQLGAGKRVRLGVCFGLRGGRR